MLPCSRCQNDLLAYLYDLLDVPDREELEAHLEICPACQTALRVAREQQGMLSAAVKQVHAGVVFKAPVEPPVLSVKSFAPSPRRRPSFVARWAAAAAVLLVILSAASWAGWHHRQYQQAQLRESQTRLASVRSELQNSESALAVEKVQTQQEIRALQAQIGSLFKDWQQAESRARKVLNDQEFAYIIYGPQNARLGNNNSFVIEARQQDAAVHKDSKAMEKHPEQQQKAQNMLRQARIVDQSNNAILYEQNLTYKNERANFDMPGNLPIKPGANLAWEFKDDRDIVFTERMNVVFPEYVTHLTTDRPSYRPGETVRFRSLTLQRFSLKPAQENFHLLYRIVGPNNTPICKHESSSQLVAGANRVPVKGPDGQPIAGIGVGECALPADLPPGQYDLCCSEANERFREEKRSFTVEDRLTPAQARETPKNAEALPARDVQVEFFPEGGELVAGVPNWVYFQARNSAGKPVALGGRLLTDQGKTVAQVHTMADDRQPGLDHGLGRFTFTPQAGHSYRLRADAPDGVEQVFALPAAKKEGVVLHVDRGVLDKEIPLTLHSVGKTRELLVGAFCRGNLLAHTIIRIKADRPERVILKPHDDVAGVCRITVYEVLEEADAVFHPVAERLIYRRNGQSVDVNVAYDKDSYRPGERVKVTLKAQNEQRQPVGCVALLAVTDARGSTQGEQKTAPSMLAHFLLLTEIRDPEDLENADLLLGSNPRAAEALDLLLGSQGWRRFAEQDPQQFQKKQRAGTIPVFLSNNEQVRQLWDSERKQIEKLDQKFASRAIEIEKQLADKESQAGAQALQHRIEGLRESLASAENEYDHIAASLREMQILFLRLGLAAAFLTLLFPGCFFISAGLRRYADGLPARPWFLAGLGLLAILAAASITACFTLESESALPAPPQVRLQLSIPPKERKPFADPLPEEPVNEMPGRDRGELIALHSKVERAKLDDEAPAKLADKVELAEAKKINKKLDDGKAPTQRRDVAELKIASDVMTNAAPPGLVENNLRREGNYQGLFQRQLGRQVQLPAANDPGIVRVYAFQRGAKKETPPGTIYWNPVLVLPAGKAQVVEFNLPDTGSHYDVRVLSHTLDGRLGTNRATINSTDR